MVVVRAELAKRLRLSLPSVGSLLWASPYTTVEVWKRQHKISILRRKASAVINGADPAACVGPFIFGSAAASHDEPALTDADTLFEVNMDHHAAARAHTEGLETRISKQRRLIELLEGGGRYAEDERHHLALLEKALFGMRIGLAGLLPTTMDASRPNYREPNGQTRKRGHQRDQRTPRVGF